MARYCSVFVLFVASLVGCAHTRQPAAPAMAPFGPLVEGNATAYGLLDFVNDHGHDLALLDRSLGLERRAAEAIVAHRVGDDGLRGTADDGLFLSLAELDATPWVGPAAMQRLAGHASALGYMDSQQRVVGSFEGVRFTFREAEQTLELVNSMSARSLDTQLHLDARAVRSITEARPLRSLDQLSELYWVGPSTLTRLRDHAVTRSVAAR